MERKRERNREGERERERERKGEKETPALLAFLIQSVHQHA